MVWQFIIVLDLSAYNMLKIKDKTMTTQNIFFKIVNELIKSCITCKTNYICVFRNDKQEIYVHTSYKCLSKHTMSLQMSYRCVYISIYIYSFTIKCIYMTSYCRYCYIVITIVRYDTMLDNFLLTVFQVM